MNLNSKIFVAGHNGLVGSSILKNLISLGFTNIIVKSHSKLDLMNQKDTESFFQKEKPEYIFLAAAKVGGIMANDIYSAQFIYENNMIQNNVIHCSWKYNVKKLLFLGSSCIYPKFAQQPIKEEYLLNGFLEKTNEFYSIAKINGLKMCESYHKQYGCNFISVMPTNLYGPNDNYNLQNSHVLPAIIRKLHLGKLLMDNNWTEIKKDLDKNPIENINGNSSENDIIKIFEKYGIIIDNNNDVSIIIWGTGDTYREFLHVDDMAQACIFIMTNIDSDKLYKDLKLSHINIGTGEDLTIRNLTEIIKNIIGFNGNLKWDKNKPDGTPKKLLDVTVLNNLGWKHQIDLINGIKSVYDSYKKM